MNIGIIFAGGIGQRMTNISKPKQFLELYGVPIIIYTLRAFDNHPEIDYISVSCIESWIPYFKNLLKKFHINKVRWVVPGGKYGQSSIFNALEAVYKDEGGDNKNIVLINDGVRPLISQKLISDNIKCVKMHSSAITVVKTIETGIISEDGQHARSVLDRNILYKAKAPQSFYLEDIYSGHKRAMEEGIFNSIDSCSLMTRFGMKVHFVESDHSNIKITTPEDYYIFKALYDLQESQQILGLS